MIIENRSPIVRVATFSDIPDVVEIHIAAFPSFFLTQMGPAFLSAYYNLVISHTDGILLLTEGDNHETSGFVAGSMNPAQFYQVMSKRKWEFVLPIALGVINNPSLIGRILENYQKSRKFSKVENTSHPGTPCELTSIGVASSSENRGIGKILTNAFIEEVRGRGGSYITLTTDALDNDRVNSFYVKNGFTFSIKIVAPGQRIMNEYVMHLAPSEVIVDK